MLIIILPFINTFNILLFGRFYSFRTVCLQTILCYSIVTYFLLIYLYQVYILNQTILFDSINFVPIINFYFIFNKVNLALLTPVIIISFLINIFTFYYLYGDPFNIRFYGLLNLFSAFMILLVSSEHLLLLFFGWEGIGIASFLLISFYYNSSESIKSSLSAFYINKIGDLFLIIAIILISFTDHSLIAFSLIIAATTKSAQFPFYKWLPESMCAPTPVSALLHAATLVTAGVFLLIKTWFFINPNFSIIILYIGTFTTVASGFIAVYQYDIKRIIAFSTCSQIALCFVAIGLSQYTLALYHLFNHSFYKALLFLCAGVIIHTFNNRQDIREFGGVWTLAPWTSGAFVVASFSLMACPGFSGFYSKEAIIDSTICSSVFLLIWISAICTIAYSTNMIFIILWKKPACIEPTKADCLMEPFSVIFCIIILVAFSFASGYLTIEFKNLIDEEYFTNFTYEYVFPWWLRFIMAFFVPWTVWYNFFDSMVLESRSTYHYLSKLGDLPAIWQSITKNLFNMCEHINLNFEQIKFNQISTIKIQHYIYINLLFGWVALIFLSLNILYVYFVFALSYICPEFVLLRIWIIMAWIYFI